MAVDKELVNKTIETLKGIIDEIKGNEKWTIKTVIDLGQEVVKRVEKLSFVTTLPSEDKLDLAVQVLDSLVKLPFYLEVFDGPLFPWSRWQCLSLHERTIDPGNGHRVRSLQEYPSACLKPQP